MAGPPPAKNDYLDRFVAGTCSGVALVLVGHPLDTLKVRMQTGVDGSLRAAFGNLVRSEGIRGLYRGMLPPLVLTGGINTVLFGIQFNLVAKMQGDGPPRPANAMKAAVISGALISVLVTPMELTKSRLQVVPLKDRVSLTKMLVRIWKEHGILGLYKGWSAVVLTRASNFAYFGGYAQAQSMLEPYSPSRVVSAVLAGGCAGITYWLVAFPFDVCKAKMMVSPEPMSLLQAARRVYADNGLRGFTRGFSPTALRAFPANAAAFLAFEAAMRALEGA